MRYYYIAPNLKTLLDNANLFVLSEYMATQKQEVPLHGDEVLMWASFSSLGDKHAWEATPGVEPLPDPLETDPVSDAHMTKLTRFHDYDHQPGKGWTHRKTGAVGAPHTRKLMSDLSQREGCMGSFKFHLFA